MICMSNSGHGQSTLSSLARDIYDGSRFGIVERDIEDRVLYANRVALEMLGATDYQGLVLADTFADADARAVLQQESEQRRKGELGNYRVALTRLDDRRRKVNVEITGLPVLDAQGSVIGSLGIFRSLEEELLTTEIRDLTLKHAERDELLKLVAERVATVLPYDLLMISRVNADDRESEVYFCHPPFRHDVPRAWFRLDEDQWAYMLRDGGGIHRFQEVMSNPPWNRMQDEPVVRQMTGMGLQRSLWRLISRGEGAQRKPVATITLLSRNKDAYTDSDRQLLDKLPLVEAVLRALDNERRELEAARLRLFQGLNRASSAREACTLMAKALVEMFDWAHVSLFRVDHGTEMIHLVDWEWNAAGSAGQAPGRAPDYQQHFSAGVLGRVVRTRKAQNIGDVAKDENFVPGPHPERVASELAVPIVFANEDRVRFIINVDDPRLEAFSTEHVRLLTEIADEVAGVMQRISQVAFLTECFDNASDPIIATDARLRIRKVNPAAAALFGFVTPEAVRGSITDYFEDAQLFEGLADSKRENLGELKLKQRGDADLPAASAFVTRKDFPDTLGGHVFIARDVRDIRRTLQLEVLSKAAYEVAVETQAPLALAISHLQALASRSDGVDQRDLQKTVRQLERVKNSYSRLALYDRDAKRVPRHVCRINLNGELHSLRGSLTREEAERVVLQEDAQSVEVMGDHVQVRIVLETLLSVLVRAAPENDPVRVRIASDDGADFVYFLGKLPTPVEGSGPPTGAEVALADSRRADPLLRLLMGSQGGSLQAHEVNGKTEFALRFTRESRNA